MRSSIRTRSGWRSRSASRRWSRMLTSKERRTAGRQPWRRSSVSASQPRRGRMNVLIGRLGRGASWSGPYTRRLGKPRGGRHLPSRPHGVSSSGTFYSYSLALLRDGGNREPIICNRETAMMKRICCLLLVMTNCKSREPPASAMPVVVLGQVIDRTGSMATPSWVDSIRLAVITANAALKREGRAMRFELAEANSGNSPEQARADGLHLVKQQGAKAIITDSRQDDIAVNMLAYDGDSSHELNVPVVCMAYTTPDINNPEAQDADPVKQAALRNLKGWNFRTTMSSAYQAPVLVRMLLASTRRGRFQRSMYASDDPYGRGFSDALKADMLKARPNALIEQVFHDVKVNPAQYDWASDVAKMTDKHNESTGKDDGAPDAVVEITFPKFAMGFTKAFLASGSKARLVHTHNFRGARVLETLKRAVEGQEGSSHAVLC